MDKLCRTDECVTMMIEKYKIIRLPFADDLVLLTFESGIQHVSNGFASARDIAGMKISTSKTEILHLSRYSVQCSTDKNAGVVFTSDGRQDKKMDVRSSKASALMQTLYYPVVLKWELSINVKLSYPFSFMVINLG